MQYIIVDFIIFVLCYVDVNLFVLYDFGIFCTIHITKTEFLED